MRAVISSVALAVLAIAGAAAVLAADDAKILGQDAPPISTKEFLNSDGRTSIADYKGEVVYLECFATW
jgi:hypothetical protein